MEVEWEGVTAGEGMWWLGPLSLVMIGDSVFTVLDDDVAGFKDKWEISMWRPLFVGKFQTDRGRWNKTNETKDQDSWTNERVWGGLVFIKPHYSLNWIVLSTVTVHKKRQCWEYLLSCVPCVFMPLYPFYGGEKWDVFSTALFVRF